MSGSASSPTTPPPNPGGPAGAPGSAALRPGPAVTAGDGRQWPPGPLIRPAEPGDAARVIAIRSHAIRTSPGLWIDDVPPQEQQQRWAADHVRDGTMLVAQGGGEVLGYATITPLRSYSGYRHTGEVSVYVAEGAQGRGVGAALLSGVLTLAPALGMHSLSALVEAGNAASIALHRRRGFEEVGRMPEAGRKFDRWWDLIVLHRLL